jgi:adenylate kinase
MVAPPGAGKGTQATKLAAHYGIVHLSSGDLLRKEVVGGTRIGRIAASYLLLGDLVPDELVIEMLVAPVLDAARTGGYVLDGFPRTVGQAEEAHRLAAQVEDIDLQAVLHLEVSREELHRRFLVRSQAEGRNDDTEVTFLHRLEVFDSDTEPLLGFYAERGLVIDIDGEQPVDKVFADIVSAVNRLK